MTITGTRSTGHRAVDDYRAMFDEYVRSFARPGARFHLGGASGIDSLALLWPAEETETELVVAVPARLTDQPADARDTVAAVRDTGRLAELVELDGSQNTERYFARNRWLVDRSGFVIGFPRRNTTSSGTCAGSSSATRRPLSAGRRSQPRL